MQNKPTRNNIIFLIFLITATLAVLIFTGISVPHVEVEINGNKTEEYQFAGPAFQGLGGVNFDVYKKISLLLEYKITYSDMDADLTGGGSVEVKPWTNHFIFGLSYSFR